MLVLSRYRDESIVITAGDERIVVTVIDVRGDKVRLGVDAADHVAVNRDEIQQSIDRGEPPPPKRGRRPRNELGD